MIKLLKCLTILLVLQGSAYANPDLLNKEVKKYEKYGVQGIRMKPGILKKLLNNEKIDENDFDYNILYNSQLGSISVDINYKDLIKTD